jgi:hypothetical protein
MALACGAVAASSTRQANCRHAGAGCPPPSVTVRAVSRTVAFQTPPATSAVSARNRYELVLADSGALTRLAAT